MSLDYTLSKIKNHKQVCFTGEGEKRSMNPVTHNLIFHAMAVDLSCITDRNVGEWIFRTQFLHEIGYDPIQYFEESEESKILERTFTDEEIRQHIGMVTNVSDKTRAAFIRRWMDAKVREAERAIRNREHACQTNHQ